MTTAAIVGIDAPDDGEGERQGLDTTSVLLKGLYIFIAYHSNEDKPIVPPHISRQFRSTVYSGNAEYK